MRHFALIFILNLVVTTHAGQELQVLQNQNFCNLMLTPGANARGSLSDEVLGEIAQRISLEKINGHFQFVENIKVVTEELVEEKKLTREQADTLFAERVLGGFAP